jgi:hypothetical protein
MIVMKNGCLQRTGYPRRFRTPAEVFYEHSTNQEIALDHSVALGP